MGIKYCGGCRAGYDRVAAVNRMREALRGHVEFIPPDSEEASCILVVCGCRTACADVTPFPGRRVWVITSEEDAAAWVEERKRDGKRRSAGDLR